MREGNKRPGNSRHYGKNNQVKVGCVSNQRAPNVDQPEKIVHTLQMCPLHIFTSPATLVQSCHCLQKQHAALQVTRIGN